MKYLLTAAILLISIPLNAGAFSLGVMTDLHAGSQNTRRTEVSTVYPSKAVGYFEKSLKKMKGKVDAVAVLGDTSNEGRKTDYVKLKKVADKSGIKVLWVRGNHDSKYFNILNSKTNYYVDFFDIRIIVLDTNFAKASSNGGISPEALAFYEEKSNTDKKVIVAMHHPPFVKNQNCVWNPAYDWAKGAQTILAGHWHKGKTCGNTTIFPALSENKNLNYRIIGY